MKIHFLGANRQVTGSRYCLEAGGKQVMIDCGMFQERQFVSRNWEVNPIPPNQLDALVLTHAHLDHCGLIPRLVSHGFGGLIYSTRPTVDLAEVIMRDSAKIQEEDAAYKKKRHAREGRKGKYPETALYHGRNVDQTMPLFQGCLYGEPVNVTEAISVTFHDAGHILGSAMLEFQVRENGSQRRLLFSGDIGQWEKPLIRDPSLFEQADFVVMESTYGDRDHRDGGDVETQLRDVINRTMAQGGNLVIPTFAVERAQELMYHIGQLVHTDQIPDVPVFLDSPMAVNVTKIFRCYRECFDDESWELIDSDQAPLQFPGLKLVRSVDDSKAINEVRQPLIVMASSGMCTGGRIKHHLRNNIGDPNSTILFVGYQSPGTLGSQILKRPKTVRIHGREHTMRAEVAQIYGFSGHADRGGLIRWLSNLRDAPQQVFLTHGDEDAATSLAEHIREEMKWPVSVPEYQQVVEL
ncbi:MAG: MBL fold metallo-hydrolase [Pirellulaceae bacterium]|nr:MBL fold metallo-hydrolase [Pirellulaceae bacterium]